MRRGEGDLEAMRHRGRALRARARSWSCSRRARGSRRALRSGTSAARAHGRRADRARRRRAARAGGDRGHRPAARGSARCASPTGRRSTSPSSKGRTRRRRAGDGAADGARSSELLAPDAVRPLLVDRRRLARPPRLPRAAEVDPARRRPAGGALVGFANMLLRLWESERAARGPRRLGHALRSDLPARGVRELPERARVRRRARSSSSTCCPELVAAFGLRGREGRRLRGGRLPRRGGRVRGGARRHARSWRPPTGTRSSSRASGRRSSSRCAASPSWRGSGRPRCASATASSPSRCPTSSRCAATRPTSSPARAGIGAEEGRRHPARVRLARGRARGRPVRGGGGGLAALPSNSRAGRLRSSPSPDQTPTWAEASALREWGLNRSPSGWRGRGKIGPWTPGCDARRAGRCRVPLRARARTAPTLLDLAGRRARERRRTNAPLLCYLSAARRNAARRSPTRSADRAREPSGARASSTRRGRTPRRGRRLEVLLDALRAWHEGAAGDARDRSSAATSPAYLDRLARARGADAARPRHRRLGDELRGGAARRRRAIEAAERGGFALVRPPGHHALAGPGDGLLPVRQRRDRRAPRAGRARARAGRDRRLGRPPRQRHAGDLRGDDSRPLRLAAPVAVLSGHRRARASRRRDDASTCRSRPAAGDEEYAARLRRRRSSRRCAPSSPSSCSSRPASTPTSTTRSPRCA